jgi:glycerophosphoryl diester phosphodiesterase
MRYSRQMRALDWLVARPIAHRGLHDKANAVLENTATAFQRAIDQNFAIECDLQITADGEAVVFHDETLDRLTDSKGLLKQHSTKAVKDMPLRIGGDRMQTLNELLEQAAGRVPLIIELKSHWDGDVALALRALKVLEPYAGPYAIMSFDPDLIAAIADASPHTIRGITADRTVDPYYHHLNVQKRLAMRTLSHLPRTRPHFVSYYFRDLPFAPVQMLRAAGHPIISWTIRSPEQQQVALRYSDQVTFEGYAA